jgi:uncharacterized RDD family membrane protein YckC
MNPYRSRNIANPPFGPRPIPGPLAGRAIRVISTGIDFVALLTLHFAICSSHLSANDELEDLCGLLPHTFLVVYEIGLGTSIGKQLLGLRVHFEYAGIRYRVYRTALKYLCIPFIIYPSVLFTARRQGLHDKAARSVVVQPNGWTAWMRASLGVILSGYAMLTFGCGQFVSVLMQERYDARLVNRVPEVWAPEGSSRDGGHRLWLQGRSTPFLLSAIELAPDKLPSAEAIYTLYEDSGLDFEKRQFASWVGIQVEEGDLRFIGPQRKGVGLASGGERAREPVSPLLCLGAFTELGSCVQNSFSSLLFCSSKSASLINPAAFSSFSCSSLALSSDPESLWLSVAGAGRKNWPPCLRELLRGSESHP